MKARGRHRAVVTAARRKQILDAAATCFRRDGFRGASMANISLTAGMSTGHIYHYFESKAAIIEAVIERGQSDREIIPCRIKSFDDVIDAILEITAKGLTNQNDRVEPALLLEIFVEATRNSTAAKIFQKHRILLHANLRELLKAGQAQGVVDHYIDVDHLGCLLEVILYGSIVHMALLADSDQIDLKRMICFFIKLTAAENRTSALWE